MMTLLQGMTRKGVSYNEACNTTVIKAILWLKGPSMRAHCNTAPIMATSLEDLCLNGLAVARRLPERARWPVGVAVQVGASHCKHSCANT